MVKACINNDEKYDFVSNESFSCYDFVSTMSKFMCEDEGSFGLIDIASINEQINKWYEVVDVFSPVFKIEGLTQPLVLKLLSLRKVAFDFINRNEINCASNAVEFASDNDTGAVEFNLHSNPFKFKKDIKQALLNNFNYFTFDTESDVDRIKACCLESDIPKIGLLLRISLYSNADDDPYHYDGTSPEDVDGLIQYALGCGLQVIGISLVLTKDHVYENKFSDVVPFSNLKSYMDFCIHVLHLLQHVQKIDRKLFFHIDLNLEEIIEESFLKICKSLNDAVSVFMKDDVSMADIKYYLSTHSFFISPSIVLGTQVSNVYNDESLSNIRRSLQVDNLVNRFGIEPNELQQPYDNTEELFEVDFDTGYETDMTDGHESRLTLELLPFVFSNITSEFRSLKESNFIKSDDIPNDDSRPENLLHELNRKFMGDRDMCTEIFGPKDWIFWKLFNPSKSVQRMHEIPLMFHCGWKKVCANDDEFIRMYHLITSDSWTEEDNDMSFLSQYTQRSCKISDLDNKYGVCENVSANNPQNASFPQLACSFDEFTLADTCLQALA